MKKNIIIVMVLLLACAFAVPAAYADEVPDNGSIPIKADQEDGAGQEGSEQNALQAVLYDDGELAIFNVPSDCGNGGNSGNSSNSGNPNNNCSNGASTANAGADNAAGGTPSGAAENSGGLRSVNAASGVGDVSGNMPSGATDPKDLATTRTPVKTYDNVSAAIDSPEQAPWYNERDLISNISFGKGVAPETMAYWFAGLPNLSGVNFAGLDASQVTSMQALFCDCVSMKQIDMTGLDTSQVTNMARLFANCSSLQSVNLSGLDTRSVTAMDGMFEGCSSISMLDLSGFDTRNLVSTGGMLKGCTSLAALDVSCFSPSQVRAMAVPVDNKGGFWRLNVPQGYNTGITLRQPTAAERIAAGLELIVPDNGTNRKGRFAPVNNAGGGLVAVLGNLAGLKPVALSSVVRDGAVFGGFGLVSQSILDSAGIAAEQVDGDGSIEATRAAVARAALINGLMGAFQANPVEKSSEAGPGSLTLDGAAAFVDSIVTPSPTNPMTPLGIPLNMLAIGILLFVAVPSTVLMLRDRR